jgi:glyoxylase I family protein
MSEYIGIHHASLITADIQAALDFYQDILGMCVDDSRPDLPFPGAWLSVGEQQIHLLQIPGPDAKTGRPVHAGRDRHTAISVRSLKRLKERLEQHDIPYTLSRSGRPALFCRDPDGNGLEFMET